MKILVAPDSFKECMTAQRFCHIAKATILESMPEAIVEAMPLADGGEGTVDAVVTNLAGEVVSVEVHDPLMRQITSKYGYVASQRLAIIEMASASGLMLLTKEERDPMVASTYGTGELILHALDQGCTKIILGIGGSATHDGGLGAMTAMGLRCYDDKNQLVGYGAKGCASVVFIDESGIDPRLKTCEIVVACDVDNVLCGEQGAAYTYALQKGAQASQLPFLDQALRHLSEKIYAYNQKDISYLPGLGAAGGFCATFKGLLSVTMKPGFDVLDDILSIEEWISTSQADLLVTGEGEINKQTLQGKLPIRIAELGQKYHIPTIVLAGSVKGISTAHYQRGMTAVFSILDGVTDLESALHCGERMLASTIKNIMNLLCSQGKMNVK